MSMYGLVSRLAMFVLTAAVCAFLAARYSTWVAAGIWAGCITALCTLVALMLHLQKSQRVTPVNYLAGAVIPFGYGLGRRSLVPVVLDSAFRWSLLGLAVIVAIRHGYGVGGAAWKGQEPGASYHRGFMMTLVLFLSWVIDGGAALWMLSIASRSSSRINKTQFVCASILFLMVAASVMLTVLGHSAILTWLAVLVSGGPIVVIGGGYGLFILIVLTAGRHARWN